MFRVLIRRMERIAPSVVLYEMEALDGEHTFQPGHFFSFIVPQNTGRPLVRAYSFCSSPDKLPYFQICVREIKNGIGTTFLRQHIGRVIEITASQGEFDFSNPSINSVIYIASGVGIAPIRSLIHWAARFRPDARIRLIYRYHSRDGALFIEEWKELSKKISLELVVSEYRDYNYDKVPAFIPLTKSQEWPPQLCRIVGSPSFVRRHVDLLKRLGLSLERVFFESWDPDYF